MTLHDHDFPLFHCCSTHDHGRSGRICEYHNHNYCIDINFQLRGVPKGLKQILMERGLWPANNRRSNGFAFLTLSNHWGKARLQSVGAYSRRLLCTLLWQMSQISRIKRVGWRKNLRIEDSL